MFTWEPGPRGTAMAGPPRAKNRCWHSTPEKVSSINAPAPFILLQTELSKLVWISFFKVTTRNNHTVVHTLKYRMAGNFGGEFVWQIGGFESNPPIFHLPELHSVMSLLLQNHSPSLIVYEFVYW